MVKITRKLTPYNFTQMTNKRNMWIIIHYVGAVSTAKNNAYYFYNNDLRGKKNAASASYFVDENEIWQVVKDTDAAWHIGGATKYYNSARNNNSIGIEMCCKKDDKGEFYFEEQTIKNTIALTRALKKKYGIPIERIARHYDCTKKLCPKPWCLDESKWINFLNEVQKEETEMADLPEHSITEKCNKIKEVMNIDDNTIRYWGYYKYGVPLIDKAYQVCLDAEKWRTQNK